MRAPTPKLSLNALFVVAILVAASCGPRNPLEGGREGGSTQSAKPIAASPTPATSTASASSDNIGVPECDDFIAKYEACVSNKVPEMVRAQYQASLKQWKESWKKLAENPQTKPSLVAACKQAAEQQAAALKSFGCNF